MVHGKLVKEAGGERGRRWEDGKQSFYAEGVASERRKFCFWSWKVESGCLDGNRSSSTAPMLWLNCCYI
jgi:hypothetical protein